MPAVLRPCAKQVATVIKAYEQAGREGYLAASEGEKVQVLYVGHGEDESGWIYAQRHPLVSKDEQGWLPAEHVEGEKLSEVECKSATTPREPESGYLDCKPPQLLKVLHWGDKADTRDWIYAEAAGQQGWIALWKVQQASERNIFPHWRLVQQKTRLLPFPNVPEEDRDNYGGYGSVEGNEKWSVPAGRNVEVLAFEGQMAQVVHRGMNGWVEKAALSSDVKEAPPPPPEEPPPSRPSQGGGASNDQPPPRPARRAPRPGQESPQQQPAEVPGESAPTAKATSPTAKPTTRPRAAPPPSLMLTQQAAQSCKATGRGGLQDRDPPPPPLPPAPPARAAKAVPASSPVTASTSQQRPNQAAAKQPAQQVQPVIELVTFGLENLDSSLYDRCREHPGGGASVQIPDADLKDILRTGRNEDVDIFLDARMFPDPEAFTLTRHSGRHYKIVQRLCQHRNFPTWLKNAWHKFRKVAEARGEMWSRKQLMKPVTIGVYCRAGKHRSVAAAGILKHIFTATGYMCPEVRHLSYAMWGRNCCKGRCEECQQPPPELQDTFNDALQRWLMISN